eukprot:5699607-Pyramimonas_sp.AAC.1
MRWRLRCMPGVGWCISAAAPTLARAQRPASLAPPTRLRWRWPLSASQRALHCESVNRAGAVSWQRRQRWTR